MLSIDFMIELSKSSRYDTVITVVDSVLKRAHFILTYTMITVEEAARLFFHNV